MTQENTAKKPYYIVKVEAGKAYWWCTCGKSAKQPFCDGSHTGTGKQPLAYNAAENKDVFFCGCKITKDQPFCDGSHKALNKPAV